MADQLPLVVQCIECGKGYPLARRQLGFLTCLVCGEAAAQRVEHCVVEMHKSGLVVISPGDKELLVGISNKGGAVTGAGAGLDLGRGEEKGNEQNAQKSEWEITKKVPRIREAEAKARHEAYLKRRADENSRLRTSQSPSGSRRK